MKKKNKENHIRMRFSTLLLCCIAIVLCTAPCSWATTTYEGPGEYDLTTALNDDVEIKDGATVNLYNSVSGYIQVHPGGVLNIYSGSVFWYVLVSTGQPEAVVSVYGTNFAVDGVATEDNEFKPVTDTGSVLTGTYGNGESIPTTLFKPGLWFFSEIPIKLKDPVSDSVTIDIKPGGNPNNINLNSKGVVPVAVLTTDDFDASNVNPNTVLFAGAEPERWTLCDVDDDGDDDLLFHFKTQKLLKSEDNPDGLDENSTTATLTAKLISTMKSTTTTETADGEVIQGTDEVCIKPQKKKK